MDLSDAVLDFGDLPNADLRGAKLIRARLDGARSSTGMVTCADDSTSRPPTAYPEPASGLRARAPPDPVFERSGPVTHAHSQLLHSPLLASPLRVVADLPISARPWAPSVVPLRGDQGAGGGGAEAAVLAPVSAAVNHVRYKGSPLLDEAP
ncbi:pentapeptide repeat-containing protein [Streptomyces sp. NPDC058740]|uniref:pentapeptide repeat-containing protein n=1 Tax=Streptomyces sp. NPDC058740 TaxID=3346619 RepID=UPI0036BA0216